MTSDDHLPRLPSEFQGAFELAKAKADLKYATRFDACPNRGHFDLAPLDRLVRIQEEFFAYCTQARNACRTGHWSLAELGHAVYAAWPHIFDSYSDRELGASPEETRRLRTATWRTITDDRRWKQHLTELVAFGDVRAVAESTAVLDAEAATDPSAEASGKAGPTTCTDLVDGDLVTAAQCGRVAIVDDFLVQCNLESGLEVELVRKHISLAAGHKYPRQFQYWQACDPRATAADNQNFGRIVRMTPADFVKALRDTRVI